MKPFFASANEKESKVYGAISGIFSLFAILGLLMGYFTKRSPIGHAIAGGETILQGSLMGAIIEMVRGSIKMPSYNLYYGFAGFLPMALYIFVLILLCAVLLSQLLTICALLIPRFSRTIALFQGRMLFFAFLLPLLANALLYVLFEGKFTPSPFDLPCFLSAVFVLCVLVFSGFAEGGKRFLLNFLLFSMSLLCVCAYLLPATSLLTHVNLLTSPAEENFLRVVLILFSLICLLNFGAGLFRLHAKGGYGLDIARFFLQLILFIVLGGVFLAADTSLFAGQPLAAVFLLLGSLGGLLLSLLFFAAHSKWKFSFRRREKAPKEPLPAN